MSTKPKFTIDRLPLRLEVNAVRGTIALYGVFNNKRYLLVRRIQDELIRIFYIQETTVVIDLRTMPPRRKRAKSSPRTIKTDPVYVMFADSTIENIYDLLIVDSQNQPYFILRAVPEELLTKLWFGEYVEIVIGVTNTTPKNRK